VLYQAEHQNVSPSTSFLYASVSTDFDKMDAREVKRIDTGGQNGMPAPEFFKNRSQEGIFTPQQPPIHSTNGIPKPIQAKEASTGTPLVHQRPAR
jgi:hypothetical protein